MDKSLLFCHLSPPRQHLVRLFQSINYGYLQDLEVRDCEPIFSGCGPIVLVDVRLDSEDRPRDELALADFALCAEICRMMSLLDRVENGRMSKIEVRAGIPRRITMEKLIAGWNQPCWDGLTPRNTWT
jgi:hypothetical protein